MPTRRCPTSADLVAAVDERIEHAVQHALDAGEIGFQVAAYVGNDLVVDVAVGVADETTGVPVQRDTLFCVFSVTKAITVTALHLQVERGLVDYDAPVCHYWPEFAAHGKEDVTVRQALTHRAGIPQMPPGVTPERMCDWSWMARQVANMEPMFQPGTSAYHSLVFGWIIGELVVRTDPTHRPFGRFVREEFCGPLAIDDLWLGVPDTGLDRVARLSCDMSAPEPGSIAARTMPWSVAPVAEVHNRRDVIQACLPGAGAVMSARAGARFFAMLASGGTLDGVRVLADETVRAQSAARTNPGEVDQALMGGAGVVPPIGNGGYWLADQVAGAGPNLLCHGGSGGSIGWADLDRQVGAVVCHNRMIDTSRPGSSASPFLALGVAIRAIADELA
jgi:CubicO group peptidase (beta-lactamase class C family)